MGQALYRKYRPKKLSDVVGQNHITSTLKNAIKNGKISHAYLFTGPRGVGKTSVARILAHEVNGFAYNDDSYNLDIIEIDAASNRRIDEIRDLRDKVHIAPSTGKFKIYIIDEAHMLTKEAFNALLKTLEEPPAHVIFILATTESHKMPQTIISRTQRFPFRPIGHHEISKLLRSIADSEKIDIDNEALLILAQHSDGSFRDAIGMLDQASSGNNKVSAKIIHELLGIAPGDLVDSLLASLNGPSAIAVIEILNQLINQGFTAPSIAKQLADLLRNQLIADNMTLTPVRTAKLIKSLIEVSASADPQRTLEIILLDTFYGAKTGVTQDQPKSNISSSADSAPIKAKTDKPIVTDNIPTKSNPTKSSFGLDMWQEALASIKDKHNSFYSILRMGKPSINGNKLTLSFQFPFHHKRVCDTKNRQIIQDALKQYTSRHIIVESMIDQDSEENSISTPDEQSKIQAISNIFGSAEMLDS